MAKLAGVRVLALPLLLAAGALQADALRAQESVPPAPPESPGTAPLESDRPSILLCLGRDLFHDGRLSSNSKVSCATCHDPGKSFADGLSGSTGVLGIDVGRNSPTLWAVKHMALFPGTPPAPASRGIKVAGGAVAMSAGLRTRRSPEIRAISLRERCLAPIENPVEMGTSVEAVVRTLRSDAGLQRRFDDAFGAPGGATDDRLAIALATYLESLDAPRTRFHDVRDGDGAAFSDEEKAGLEVFTTRGRCDACHSGPGLTDGLMHVAQPRNSERMMRDLTRRRQRFKPRGSASAARAPASADAATGEAMVRALASGYGSSTLETQTPTLWDITRTAPYFRDGSEPDLAAALRTHVAELRAVRELPAESAKPPALSLAAAPVVPEALRPRWSDGVPAAPDDLDAKDFARLVAFLRTLSPRSD